MSQALEPLVKTILAEQEQVLDWAAMPIPQVLQGETFLSQWIQRGFHGDMDWMQQTLPLRIQPQSFGPGMSHVLIVLWKPPQALQKPQGDACVASYAQGEDYHRTLGAFLYKLGSTLQCESLSFQFRVFCDAQPVCERELAQLAGLGWRGKNTMLIHPRLGSSFLIGGLFCNQPIQRPGPMAPHQEHCGACRRCIDACPTQAIGLDGFLNARQCISYTTIEYKGPLGPAPSQSPWIFGCDICQIVCPWNHKHMSANPDISYWPSHRQDWELMLKPGSGLTNRIKKTPLNRIGKRGLIRNLEALF